MPNSRSRSRDRQRGRGQYQYLTREQYEARQREIVNSPTVTQSDIVNMSQIQSILNDVNNRTVTLPNGNTSDDPVITDAELGYRVDFTTNSWYISSGEGRTVRQDNFVGEQPNPFIPELGKLYSYYKDGTKYRYIKKDMKGFYEYFVLQAVNSKKKPMSLSIGEFEAYFKKFEGKSHLPEWL